MCSCGEERVHVVAKRQTVDGYTVKLWSDGAMTNWAGVYLRHGGRSMVGRIKRLEQGWALMNNVCILTFAEVRASMGGNN